MVAVNETNHHCGHPDPLLRRFFVLLGLGGLLTAHIHIGSSTLLRTNVKKRNETNRQYGHPQLGPWALLCLWGVYIHTEKKEQGGLSSDQK